MSRNTQKIEKALRDRGLTAEHIVWEAMGKNMGMCGPSGGWFVEANKNGKYEAWFVGLNIEHLLKDIERYDEHYPGRRMMGNCYRPRTD